MNGLIILFISFGVIFLVAIIVLSLITLEQSCEKSIAKINKEQKERNERELREYIDSINDRFIKQRNEALLRIGLPPFVNHNS